MLTPSMKVKDPEKEKGLWGRKRGYGCEYECL